MNVAPTNGHRVVDAALAGRSLHDLPERLQSFGVETH
jgi:pyruvate/2-oxoglutarate dehydrogenase complex dihydrolipoamide acyltransferase (E2) component